MKIYLVGGAIRDQLLGLTVHERDFVVTGATPEELLAQNFKPVGKDFPVFLHPKTQEEYALARTERKVAQGYKGFVFHASPLVSLEEDLKRRDLTINAIAQTPEGELIDPYHGQQDLQKKILRHVSLAFVEDPVRILRIARFSAKLPDFTVAKETNQLMCDMVKQGEVNALVPERVWQEFHKALAEKSPARFFYVLKECHALTVLFPELENHTEGFDLLTQASEKNMPVLSRFTALCLGLSKEAVCALCQRYKVPNEFQELAQLGAAHWLDYQNLAMTDAQAVFRFIKQADGLRREMRFKQLLSVFLLKDQKKEKNALIQTAIPVIQSVNIQVIQQQNLSGELFAKALQAAQLQLLENFIAKRMR